MKTRTITLINAPSILGLRTTGVERLPDALQQAGLKEKLPIQRSETVVPPPYHPHRDSRSKMLNPRAIASYSVALANSIQPVLQAGGFPLVLGGDCTVVLGPLLALKRTGRFGLFFLDGHADFYQPEASPTGEAADMDLALASGRGPEVVTDIESQKPLVKDEDIVLFGPRDRQQSIAEGSQQVSDTAVHVFELDAISRQGVRQSATVALAQLLRQPIKGYWIHLDADVIDDQEMPAVDYRQPGGLTFAELHSVMDLLLATDKAVGLDLTIYNPALDPHGTGAVKLTHLLAASLKT